MIQLSKVLNWESKRTKEKYLHLNCNCNGSYNDCYLKNKEKTVTSKRSETTFCRELCCIFFCLQLVKNRAQLNWPETILDGKIWHKMWKKNVGPIQLSEKGISVKGILFLRVMDLHRSSHFGILVFFNEIYLLEFLISTVDFLWNCKKCFVNLKVTYKASVNIVYANFLILFWTTQVWKLHECK